MKMIDALGVQSWCFRHFKGLDALIAQLKRLGLSRVELCEVHADVGDEAGFEGVIGKFREAGIAITSIGVQTFKDDAGLEEKWFKFCKLAGAKMISTNIDVASMPGGLQTAQRLAEKYEVKLGIHNHGGYHWLGNVQMVRHVLKNMGPMVGLCLDTAWCMQTGDDPVKWVEEFGEKLYGVHVKDFAFDCAGRWKDVVVGTGNLRLRVLMEAVGKAKGVEAVTIEYEGDVEDPGPALHECVAKVMKATTT